MFPARSRAALAVSLFFALLFPLFLEAQAAAKTRYIVTLRPGLADPARVAADLGAQYNGRLLAVWKHALRGFWVEMTAADAARLAKDRRVAAMEEDGQIEFSAELPRTDALPPGGTAAAPWPPDPGIDPLWHLQRITHRKPNEEHSVYRYGHDGDGARIFVIDSGVWSKHQEFVKDPNRENAGLQASDINATANPDYTAPMPAGSIPSEVAPDPATPDESPSFNPCAGLPGENAERAGNAYHGTAVASLAAGRFVGVARGAQLLSVKAIPCKGDTTTAMLISAFDKVNEWQWLHPERRGVVSMSAYRNVQDVRVWNGQKFVNFTAREGEVPQTCDQTCVRQPELTAFEHAVNKVIDDGTPVVASANNQDTDACYQIPGRMSRRGGRTYVRDGKVVRTRVITVGGIDAQDQRWDFWNEAAGAATGTDGAPIAGKHVPNGERGSNYGQCVDIWAPASPLVVAMPDDKGVGNLYAPPHVRSGTSFAAPIVAGVIARILGEDSSLAAVRRDTADRVWDRLKENATHLDATASRLGTASPKELVYLAGVTFTQQPRDTEGTAPVTLQVGILQTHAAYAYRWMKADGTGAPGENDKATYSANEAGTYFVRVTRCADGESACADQSTEYWAESRPAKVTFTPTPCVPPVIEKQPLTQYTETNGAQLKATLQRLNVSIGWELHRIFPPAAEPVASGTIDAKQREDDVLAEAVATVTLDATDPALEVSTYEFRFCIGGCTTQSCAIKSDTAQIRRCQSAPQIVVQHPPAPVRITSSQDLLQFTAPTEKPSIRTVWVYRQTKNEPWKPLRIDANGTWLSGESINPQRSGWYAVLTGTACDSTLSNDVEVESACRFKPRGQISGHTIYGEPPVATVPSGTRVTLSMDPVGPTGPGSEELRYKWPGESRPGPSASWTTTVADGPQTFTVEISDGSGRSDCVLTFTFTITGRACGFVLQPKVVANGQEIAATDGSYRVPADAQVTLNPAPTTTGSLKYAWTDESGQLLSQNTTYAVPPVTSSRNITVTVSDVNNCARIFTYVLIPAPPAACTKPFRLAGGFCEIVDAPHIRLEKDRVFPMKPWISDLRGVAINLAPTDADPHHREDEATFYRNWHFKWVTRTAASTVEKTEAGVGIAYRQRSYVSTGQERYVDVTATSPEGCSASMTYHFQESSAPACTVNCFFQGCAKRRAVRSDGAVVPVKPFNPGQSVTLSIDDVTDVTAYEWHRLMGGNDTIIGTTPTVTVTLTETAEYWAVLTIGGLTTTSARLLAVPDVASGDVRVTPEIVSVRAGGDFTLTASFSRASSTTRYEWRRARVRGAYNLADAVVGRESTLFIRDLGDNSSFWCLVTEVLGDGSEITHPSNFSNVTVECTPYVSGRVNAHPPFIPASHPSLLGAAVHGKDVTLQWYRVGADGVTQTPIAYGAGAVNVYPSAAATRYGAFGTDSCGTSGYLDEATVYVCIPTITQQPRSVVIRGNTAATLTASAVPAMAGQSIAQTWHDAQDQYELSPLGSGTSFTTPVLAPGTSQSFKAAFKAACTSGVDYTLDSEVVVVEACADPQLVDHTAEMWSARPGSAVGLSIYADGVDLTYQWYVGNSGDTSTPLEGKVERQLTVYPQTTTKYWCRITSRGVCTTDTPVTLVRVCTAPEVAAHPASVRVWQGERATLTVAGSQTGNTEPIEYQWQQGSNGGFTDIAGARAASFTTPPMNDTLQSITYRALVIAGRCSTPSNAATVSVCTYPQVVAARSAESRVAYNGSLSLLLPDLSPVETKSVTWYRGARGDRSQPMRSGSGTNFANDTGPLTSDTRFWAEFTHLGCKSETETYTVRVCIPDVTTQAVSRTIAANTPTTLTIAATAIPGQTFQWYSGAVGNTSVPVANGAAASVTVTPSATTTYWCRVTTPCGLTDDSDPVTVNVCTPASIAGVSASPSGSVPAGTRVALSVNANGLNRTAQWYRGARGDTSSPVDGATLESLSVTADVTRSYWCRITTDGVCASDSDAVTVAVCTPPSINAQPQSQILWPGETAALTAGVTVPQGVTYQWYTGASGNTSSPVSGATASSYNATPNATTSYWVRAASGGCSTSSNAATVTVCVLPKQVDASPATQDIFYGDVVTLSLPPMSPAVDKNVTWYRGAAGDKSAPVHSGVNASFKTAVTVTTQYWAEFEHAGCVSRTTTYTVRVCKPRITAEPQGAMVNTNQRHVMSVGTTGEGLQYQWYSGASGNTAAPVPGETSATFTTPPMQSDTPFWCRVSGCGVSVDSAAAMVSVCVAPTIQSITKEAYWTIGAPGQLTVHATGPNLTYQWYRGQSGDTSNYISGETNATYNFTLAETEYYWVRVTSTCTNGTQQSVDSQAVLYSVAPKITQQPQSTVPVPSGGRAELSVTATGKYLSYQWYQGAGTTANPVGENKPTFVTPPNSTTTDYWVRVRSGDIAYANSTVSTVKICSAPNYTGFTKTPAGDGDDYGFTVTVSSTWRSLVKYHWYSGTVGVPSQSIDRGVQSAQPIFWNITPFPTTFWVRIWKTDGTCYVDTFGLTVP